MELVDQHTKLVMEGCKDRARAAGLVFQDETLEYIVTNRDLLELSPKMMIPTLYDYWVHDVEVLKERGKYELYPSNPYETVINTRPAISFYNDNNPDWLNVMIFYHVLAHVDFFQNNLFFRHTWDYDFNGQALADKRLLARLRSEHGRWVDYVIEFARGLDNLVGYFGELNQREQAAGLHLSERLNYYFDVFLQQDRKATTTKYLKEVDRYNLCRRTAGDLAEQEFFAEVHRNHPEFTAAHKKHQDEKESPSRDILQYLARHSPFLNQGANRWMQSVMEVVRKTSLFFQPQIRTKIMNEGWASYWHHKLFLEDERIAGHEVDYARTNARVTSLPRVGLNPYALGMRLFEHVESLADQGRVSYDFQRLADQRRRRDYDRSTGGGRGYIMQLRENLCDFTFIQTFVDQDFVDRYRLFVSGKRLNPAKRAWEYYVKSRRAADYRKMLMERLYHPPHVEVDPSKSSKDELYLVHRFEGKPLVSEFIAGTLLGVEYLWGGPVSLETSEVHEMHIPQHEGPGPAGEPEPEVQWQRVLYTMRERKLYRKVLG